MPKIVCEKCGQRLAKSNAFCPKCGTPTQMAPSTQPSEPVPVHQSNRSPNWKKIGIIALLVLIVLILPVFPRDRVVYVDGATQTLIASTSFNISNQAYANPTNAAISLYQGTLQYIPDQYYNYYFNNQLYSAYQYGFPYNGCYPFGYYCSYPYYYYPYNGYYRGSYNYGYQFANTITVQPGDKVVGVQQTPESNGFSTLVLTHADGTTFTYRHVYQQNLTQSGSTVVGIRTMTGVSAVTNSVVNRVTTAIQCQQCIMTHVTDHVSLLQLLLNF